MPGTAKNHPDHLREQKLAVEPEEAYLKTVTLVNRGVTDSDN
jgi:hypothetical protein